MFWKCDDGESGMQKVEEPLMYWSKVMVVSFSSGTYQETV